MSNLRSISEPLLTMSPTRAAQVEEYGWTAVSCDPQQRAATNPPTKPSVPQLVKDTTLPDTPLVKDAMEYVKAELPAHTFNHSMRVYYYGTNVSTSSNTIRYSPSNCQQALQSPDNTSLNGSSAMKPGFSPASSTTSALSTSTPKTSLCPSISTVELSL